MKTLQALETPQEVSGASLFIEVGVGLRRGHKDAC